MPWTVELGVIVALVVINGLFAGAEIAIISVRRSRMSELAERGRAGRALVELRARPERFLATVQVGITVVGASAAAFGGATLARHIAAPLGGLGLSVRTAESVALAIVVVVVSYLSLVIGELVPKSLALEWSERYALAAARPLLLLARLSSPVVWLLTASSNLVLRPFGDRTSFTESRISRDELLHLVDEASESGEVHPRARDIASRAIELSVVRVPGLMIPRGAIRSIAPDATTAELSALLAQSDEERFVVAGERDEIAGYLTARDLARILASDGETTLRDVLRPVHVVPETALALDVLGVLQKERVPIAMVVDDSGSVEGIVDIDDLAEEVVGTLLAGAPPDATSFTRGTDGSVVLSASTRVHVANRLLDLDLPIGPRWSTLGGLVLSEHGAMPAVGAVVTLADGTVIEVIDTAPRRIRSLRIRPPRRAPEPP